MFICINIIKSHLIILKLKNNIVNLTIEKLKVIIENWTSISQALRHYISVNSNVYIQINVCVKFSHTSLAAMGTFIESWIFSWGTSSSIWENDWSGISFFPVGPSSSLGAATSYNTTYCCTWTASTSLT